MSNSEAGKLSEEIFTFTFRNKGSIRIPKSKREIAYIQAVDIFIESISYTSYKSEKTEPDESFYGYATLVFQDALSDKIPLRFGRNRIYQERNEQALSQWEFHRQFYSTKDYVDSYYRLLTEPDAPIPAYNPPKPLFVELPLRELYIECQINTQFKIEYTQWQPVAYTNDNSITFDGKSQQQDGDKDGGLPANGTQPRQNSPSNPFANNSAPDNQNSLGEFYNSKFGVSGENSDLNDEAQDPNRNKYGIVWSWTQSCRPSGEALPIVQRIKYPDLLPTDTIQFNTTSNACNQDFLVRATNVRTQQVYSEFFSASGGFNVVGGANPSYDIVLVTSQTGWLN